MQAATAWVPPEPYDGFGKPERRAALLEIDTPSQLKEGLRYSKDKSSQTRWAGHALLANGVKTEGAAKSIISDWLKSGTLEERDWMNPGRRGESANQKALWVDWTKAPDQEFD